jgi:hypothetical protein
LTGDCIHPSKLLISETQTTAQRILLEEGAAESLTYVTSLAVWPTNHCPGAQFISSYNLYLTAASSTSANAATNVTADVSPEPVILQIQDNGNDLEEEQGGDDFVVIDDMLLDELDLSGLLRRLNLLRQLLRRLLRQSL